MDNNISKSKYLTLEDINSYESTSAVEGNSSIASYVSGSSLSEIDDALAEKSKTKRSREDKINDLASMNSSDGYTPDQTARTMEEWDNLTKNTDKIAEAKDSTYSVDETQSNWAKAGNSLVRTVVGELVGGTIESVGAVMDAGAKVTGINWLTNYILGTEDIAYNNFMTKGGKDLREWTNDNFQIYRENPGKAMDWGDFGYYAEHAPSVISSLTMMIPSMAVMKGATIAGTAAKAYGAAREGSKLAKMVGSAGKVLTNRVVQTGMAAVTSRSIENYREASQTYDTTYKFAYDRFAEMGDPEFNSYKISNSKVVDEAKDFFSKEDITKEELSQYIATRSADKTFSLNYGNLFWDILQFTAIGKLIDKGVDAARPLSSAAIRAHGTSIGMSEKAIKSAVLKGKTKEALLWVAAALPEAPEEMLNYISGKEGERYANQMLDGDPDATLAPYIPTSVLGSYINDEFWEAGIWGAIGSGVFAGGISATRKGGSSINKVLESKGKKPWFNIVDIDTEHRLQLEEINNRTASTDTYKANLTLIANGQNPFEVVQDSDGNPILDADGNPTHTIVVTPEDKRKLANQATKEYVREISRRAVRAGTVDYLKDYINTTTPNIAEDTETNAMLQDDLYNRVDASSKKSVLDKLAFNLVNLFNDKEYRDPRYQTADNGSNADILKAIINDEIDQINKLYKQQYNDLLVEDSVHSSINDIIIENNIESILKQRDLQEDINEYEAKLDRYVDSNDNTYKSEFATNGGRETVNNLVTAVAYESLMQTREDLVAETDTKKIKALESHIKSLEKLLENRGIDPKSDTLQIDDKPTTVEGLLNKIDNQFNINSEDAYNYAFQNIVKDLLNNNIVTTKEGVIASAKEIEDAFMSNINSSESRAKSIIESAMRSAETLDELDAIAKSILDTKDYAPAEMSKEEFAKLASFIAGGNRHKYVAYVLSVKRINENRLNSKAAAATAEVISAEEEVKSTEEEAETPPSTGVVITAGNMFDYYYYGSTTATVNVIYDTTSPIEIYVDHIIDGDIKITPNDTSNINKLNEYITSGAITVKPKINTITEDNALSYNYESSTINIEVSLNDESNIQVTSDEGGFPFTLENVEAIDYLNNLILENKLKVTPKPTFQGADNTGLTEAIDAVLSTGSTITADNLSNYTYTITTAISNGNIKDANTITIEEDDYGITLTLSNNNNDESDYYTDDDALDYINNLIKQGKVNATLITDGNTLYSAMADIEVTNAVDEFIKASLKARNIKLNARITPINLLDLLFHAKDVNGDIVKTIALRDKILSEFKTNKALRSKYRINDIDIATVSSSSLYSIINKGRPDYIKYLSDKAIKEGVTGVFNLDTSNLNSIFNENGKLTATNRAVYEAVMNLKPKESKIVIRKADDDKVYSYIQYEGTEVKLGSIPYVRVLEDGTVISKVKGLNYIINGDSIGIIDNLIKDINNMSTDEFVALYEALLEYKYSTELSGETKLDDNILNFINSNEVVNNFLYNRSDESSDNRTMIKHLAEIFTFKDIRANVTIEGTGELNDVHNDQLKRAVVKSLGAWKSKVINNNNNYKVFNDIESNKSVELEVEFVNKGFVNTSNKPVHIADAFSKDEIDNFALGQARIEENATVIRFEGMQPSDKFSMNTVSLSPGASFLIYRDANGKPMRINTINAPFSPKHDYGDYKPSIRSAGYNVRNALQSDMEAMVADMLSSANMPNTNAANTGKLDDIYKYLSDVLIGQPMKDKKGDVVRNVGGLISGSSLLLIRTKKGFTISRRIDGKFVYLNFEYNDGRANMYYNTTDKGKRKTGSITKDILYRFFNLDSSDKTRYLQLNNDYIKLSNKSEYVLPRYSANSKEDDIKFKNYKDYLISTGALMVKVAPVKDRNGKTVISGFIPTADMLGDGIRVGSPLSIKVKFPNVETTTPVGVAINPIETNEPTPVTNETSKTNVKDTIDKLDTMLSDGSITKVGNLISTVNHESRYSVLSEMLDKLNVTIHPKVLKVGESNDVFNSGEVPNAYAIYVRGTNTIYLTDKMKTLTNNDEIIRTIVHEAIHSIIHSNSYNTKLLEDVYKAAEKSTDPTIETYMNTFKVYGDNKFEEFLVEALTSVSFANALNNETSVLGSNTDDTVENKSLLQQLFDAVRAIIKKLQPSLLTDVNFIINKMESELASKATSLSIDAVDVSTETTEQDNTTPTTEEDVTEAINNTETIGIDIVGAFDINNADDSSFDELDMNDLPFSNIPDIKPISNMNTYRESLPDKLRSEFDKQVANGNITYICS